jgi:Protein of unknown function (DUF664)
MIEEYARHCGHADLLRERSTAGSANRHIDAEPAAGYRSVLQRTFSCWPVLAVKVSCQVHPHRW